MKRLIKWLNYCYYRSAKWYSSFGDPYYGDMGERVLGLVMMMNLLSIVIVLLSIWDSSLFADHALFIGVICAVVPYGLFLLVQEDYAELDKIYREENNSKRRGRYVLAYILGSVLLFVIVAPVFW